MLLEAGRAILNKISAANSRSMHIAMAAAYDRGASHMDVCEASRLARSEDVSPCVALTEEGVELENITPNCFVYLACGEDCICMVDEFLRFRSVW